MARSMGIFGTQPRMAKPLVVSGVGLGHVGLGSDWTWKNTTENSEVKAFQSTLNTFLKKYGYNSIAVDGKLGPATCGAWLHLMNTVDGIGNQTGFPGDPADNWGSVCQAWTYPTKIGGTKPETNPIIDEIVAKEDHSLPWGTQSSNTTAAQTQINQHLVGHDMVPIGVDGKMGGATCGAFRWLDQNTGSVFESMYGENCQSFTMPSKASTTQAPTATPIVVLTPDGGGGGGTVVPTVLPVTPSKPKVSTAAMVTGVAVLGGLGAVAWWWSKKKGYVANKSRRRRSRRR